MVATSSGAVHDGGQERSVAVLRAELVAQGPDLILVQTVPATRALCRRPVDTHRDVTLGNPVEHGLVADYRKPGGNVTGSIYTADEDARKLLQLLREAAPGLRSVAVFINPSNEAAAPFVKQIAPTP